MDGYAKIVHAASRLRKGLQYGADMHTSAQLCAADGLNLIEQAMRAPELAAAREMLEVLEGFPGVNAMPDKMAEWIVKMDAAIAKAKGEA